ncbi:MAG: fused MFS/spermidine synthase [bacterium]
MNFKKYTLEIVTFLCGAIVMVFELVGSRVLGPYFGTSTFVWTSLIGIILGSLSLGYYFGGRLADKKPNINYLASIILASAISIFISIFIKRSLLNYLQYTIADAKIAATIAASILFSPASILLGMVSPYTVRLKIEHLSNSGVTVGNLYAISTAGSIIGTFLAGFYLIPNYGTNKLLFMMVILLIIISLSLSLKNLFKTRILLLSAAILGLFMFNEFGNIAKKISLVDVDTAYNRILIYNTKDQATGKMVKRMGINNENHSSMFLDNSSFLVNEYTKYYHLAKHFNPDFKKTLMLGGAGYSFPKNFLTTYPDATMDVIEIDPKITELAKKYFNLKDDPRLTIYHEDGRVYLNQTTKKYDIIFGDAFSSHYSIPYQLTTIEAVQKKYNLLNDNGTVVLNLISAIDGDNGKFLRAEYATYKKIFPQVFLFPITKPSNGTEIQNIILVATKSAIKPSLTSQSQQTNAQLSHLWKKEVAEDIPILTDNFAPVDYYINNSL